MHATDTFEYAAKYANEPSARLQYDRYADGSTAVQVLGTDGEPILTATTCLAAYGEAPRDGHVFVKDWSENEGTLAALVAAGVVGEPVRKVPAGYATAYECELLVRPE